MTDARIAGVDPYDALRGERLPAWVRKRPLPRRMAVQVRKRVPFDMSRLLGVKPFPMAKAVGASVIARARSGHREAAESLLSDLPRTEGNLGDGAYGYEFDVQTRWAYYPAGSPNLIATVFVARGLGEAGIAFDSSSLVGEMVQSAGFVSERLAHSEGEPYYRYTLTSDRLVHNANLLGAGLVAMAGALTGSAERVEEARLCAMTSIAAQGEDGSWPYGEGASLGWSDSFHTAYNLDGLLQLWLATGDLAVGESLKRGMQHWVRDFFGPRGEPKYYLAKAYPYDIHSAGTAVDVAARLATWGFETGDLAARVAAWTERHLIDPSTGETYYQKHRFWTDKRHFVRWGDAHWALGQSSLALFREGRRDPLETAVATRSGVDVDAR